MLRDKQEYDLTNKLNEIKNIKLVFFYFTVRMCIYSYFFCAPPPYIIIKELFLKKKLIIIILILKKEIAFVVFRSLIFIFIITISCIHSHSLLRSMFMCVCTENKNFYFL